MSNRPSAGPRAQVGERSRAVRARLVVPIAAVLVIAAAAMAPATLARPISLAVRTPYAATSDPAAAAGWLEGVDVSHWQGAIDWGKVAAGGKRFAIAKVSEATDFLDPLWTTNRAGAAAAGLPVTGYHFARPDLDPNDAVAEADWFVANLGLAKGMLVPALDLERAGSLSTAGLQAWVLAWLDEVYAKTGARAMVYTSPAFWKKYMGDTSMFADRGYTVLWIAHWFVAAPTVPANNWGNRGWTFWQYDDCGTVPGITGCVDLDRYNGNDLTAVTFNPDFAVAAAPGSGSVGQGGTTSYSIAIERTGYTLPVDLAVNGLPEGASATFDATPATGTGSTLTVTTSRTGTVTPAGSYPLTITATGGDLTHTASAALVVRDAIAPTVTAPVSRLTGGTLGSTTPVRTGWSGSDASGIGSYQLQRQVNGGAFGTVSLSSPTATALVQAETIGSTYRFRLRATDRAGNTSAYAYGPSVRSLVTQQSSGAVQYRGSWATKYASSYSGGSVRAASAAGASATYTFSGAGIAWISERGPTRGAAKVYIDGTYRATVNLYASAYGARKVVYAFAWPSNGTHTIRIVVAGTARHPRVDVDAFVRLTLS